MHQNFPLLNSEDNFHKIISSSNFSNFHDIKFLTPFIDNLNDSEPIIGNYFDEINFEKILPLICEEFPSEKTREKSNNELNIFDLNVLNRQNQKNLFDKDHKEYIQQKIKENIYLKKPFKEKKIIGRKTKQNEGFGEHNKFSDDNLIRKIKHIILESVFFFINQKIIELYSNSENKESLKKKQLFKLGQNQAEKSKAEYNKLFLNKTLESIFSEDISTKYSRYSLNHNKELINNLLNEKDEKKRLIFQKIFGLTFMDCLNHFRGSIFREELSRMRMLDKYCNETDFGKNSEEYKNILKIFINNYEKIIMEKKSRNKKMKK